MKSKNLFHTLVLSISFCTLQVVHAQDTIRLSVTEVFKWVNAYHPVVKQARMLPESAQMDVRIARGNFDPKFNSYFQEKLFKDTRYYNNLEAELKVPTWIGDVKASYERFRGDNVNSMDVTPADGLYTVGYSLPVGQGLFFDARRNALRQAQLMIGMAQAEQIKIINKTLLTVAKDYWDWYFAYEQLVYNEQIAELARIRFEGISDLFKYGNQSALDSIEALNNLQLREIQLQQSRLQFQNATLQLSNHFWGENNQPVQLSNVAIPDFSTIENATVTTQLLDTLLLRAESSHPEIVKIRLKIDQLGFERRFYTEMLKPVINLDYNLLTFPGNSSNIWGADYARNNYKTGFTVGMPLFLRKERGKLRQTNIKIDQTLLEQSQLMREISNEIRQTFNDVLTFSNLLTQQRTLVINNRKMLDGEIEKFKNGESSVFLINTRESNLVNAQIKLVEFESKYAKALAFLNWAAGLENWINPYSPQ